MKIRQGPEFKDVQKPAYELLRDQFGYVYQSAKSLEAERSNISDVILTKRLTESLKAINPGLSDNGVRQAIDVLRQPLAKSLIEANEVSHNLISRWVTVDEFENGKPVGRSVRFIDFDNPENNEFLVTDEFVVKGPKHTRRMDLVIFVNGIPIVIAECKQPGDSHGITKAVHDLQAYQDVENGVVRLFHTAFLLLALKKHDAQYGTVNTPLNRYAQWKTIYPLSKVELEKQLGYKPTKQDQLIAGMLSKDNLLDLLRNFVVFDRQGGKVIKKVARYQQFEAVNRVIDRVTNPNSKEPRNERGGIVWHTQGSGKSLTMLWLCLKLRRQKHLDNPTLLIVTDRRDLDRQITETFLNCGFDNPIRASRVAHLRKLLTGPQGQTVMTTVQKFRDEVDIQKGSQHPVLSKSDNIFVLIDEAHRSEYGRFHAHMRRSLPNACLFGFTGTPIPRTTMVFGSYIHKYTMPKSVEDGATVPILYEARMPELAIWGKKIDPIFDAQFSELTPDQRERLKKQEVTERKLSMAADRISKIAYDIADHYRSNFEPDGFKAQVATCSQEAAAAYYHELSKYFPERVAVLISGTQDKGSELNDLKDKFADEETIIDSFKKDGVDRLAMIIVVDKYLTGFDAPVERVLYLDKPLKEHNLLQAIARVNRPMPEKDKTWGLIVDYWGVAGFLDNALEVFSEDLQVSDALCKRDNDSAYETLKQRKTDVFALFKDGLTRDEIEPWILALDKEDIRAIFLARYREFYKALEQLLPDDRALTFLGDFAWLRRVRKEMLNFYQDEEDTELPDCSAKVRELINQHVRAEDVTVLLEPVDVLDANFGQEVDKLHSSRAKASRMEHAVKRTITIKMHEDPAFYESLQDRLEGIIEDWKAKRIDDVAEFQLLSSLRDDLVSGQQQSAESVGLEPGPYAIYGLLNQHLGEEPDNNDEKLKDLATVVFETLESEAVIDWTTKDDVQREMKRKVKRQLRLADCPADKIDELTTVVMDLARVRLG
ncbi:Type I restriction enzyme [Gimesia panareensis]|uniref:Type I restriction enzyme endonuclease subunit n=1 Tax=Gimesia panareensis TaxID=2527978 RepID=A0A517QE70_9PLAN|nr:type I restriction endonuclease subunit R [Gimesia panareensis]QDT29894.1 Type I restriction enzyme [Gimesia panareensis]